MLQQQGPRGASLITRITKAGVALQLELLCSGANLRIVHCHARCHGLLDQALSRSKTIYHGEDNLRCKAIQLFVFLMRTFLNHSLAYYLVSRQIVAR